MPFEYLGLIARVIGELAIVNIVLILCIFLVISTYPIDKKMNQSHSESTLSYFWKDADEVLLREQVK